MRPRSKSMSDLRADSLRHTLHLNHKHEHTQVSTQLILPVEVCDSEKVIMPRNMPPKHVMPMDVTQIRAQWLRQQLRTLRTHFSSQFRYPLRLDNFDRKIFIEVLGGDGIVCIHAKALLDTGCPKNLMSRTMASKVGTVYPARTAEPIMNTLGKDKFRSLGRIDRRWASCKQRFDPKFYDAEWEVSDKAEEYDVIIGRDTMTENSLIKISKKLD